MTRQISLATPVSTREIADILKFKGSNHVRQQRARRWLKRRGILLQASKGCHAYTTVGKLMALTDDGVYMEWLMRQRDAAND